MKIKFKIQSFSDIITNSSSEVFCKIDSECFRKEIYKLLKSLLPGSDSDLEPTVTIFDGAVEVSLPIDMFDQREFFKAGIEAILEKWFNSETYTIEYEED